ncbi:AraC family transcriptional regulator [Massilia sp. H6]|uniref:AraC family transcriptional regulator n=1 Tax=Massilia sp. H6 TaxID=2970464 RepID=UPI002167E492|nr:AraC family transcriptional regulator [Massilia sp. H6]UVW28773.1 AraC family transcriptional regulator [Massilia sp. H6]
MDHLSLLLNRFSLSAGVFYTGKICGIHDFPDDAMQGHLHLVQQGPVQVLGLEQETVLVTTPTLLFLPRPKAHRLIADEGEGAEVVCGTVRFGGGGRSPIADSLPDVVLIPLERLPGAHALLGLMVDEAFAGRYGGQAALDRLCEVLMIRLLGYCVEHGLTQGGVLAGLADTRLAKALIAMHEDPARDWKLSDMAAQAGMSRARFALHFRTTVGDTPVGYLASWRIMTAQRLLRQGLQTKQVAFDVGYGSASALSRAFVRQLGCSPREWLNSQDETPGTHNETPDSQPGPAHG